MDLVDVLAELSLRNPRLQDPRHLLRHQAKVYSQNGEDGMIAEIFRRIGTKDRFFLEIGVQDGVESNTRLLLESGWSGVWIDGNPQSVDAIKAKFAPNLQRGQLRIVQAMVTRETIGQICQLLKIPAVIDFVSVDIDYNTGHVWEALPVRGRVACIEYNASLPAPLDLCVPYDPKGAWNGSNWFGHSLKALERIGRGKGMKLVGCDFCGVNAFFVAEEEVDDSFLGPFTAEALYESPKYRIGLGPVGHPASKTSRPWVAGPG